MTANLWSASLTRLIPIPFLIIKPATHLTWSAWKNPANQQRLADVSKEQCGSPCVFVSWLMMYGKIHIMTRCWQKHPKLAFPNQPLLWCLTRKKGRVSSQSWKMTAITASPWEPYRKGSNLVTSKPLIYKDGLTPWIAGANMKIMPEQRNRMTSNF